MIHPLNGQEVLSGLQPRLREIDRETDPIVILAGTPGRGGERVPRRFRGIPVGSYLRPVEVCHESVVPPHPQGEAGNRIRIGKLEGQAQEDRPVAVEQLRFKVGTLPQPVAIDPIHSHCGRYLPPGRPREISVQLTVPSRKRRREVVRRGRHTRPARRPLRHHHRRRLPRLVQPERDILELSRVFRPVTMFHRHPVGTNQGQVLPRLPQGKVGVQFLPRNPQVLAGRENHEISAGWNAHVRNDPLPQVAGVVGEAPSPQAHFPGSVIVEFQPIFRIAIVVEQAVLIRGHKLGYPHPRLHRSDPRQASQDSRTENTANGVHGFRGSSGQRRF